MTATAQQAAPSRMSVAELEAELTTAQGELRDYRAPFDRRDFAKEIRLAEETRDHQQAKEIEAEKTIFDATLRRKRSRIQQLEQALHDEKMSGVAAQVAALTEQHSQALASAREELGRIDLAALDAFEGQVDAFLEAASAVRDHATNAAAAAKSGGIAEPGLNAVKAEQVEQLASRLQGLSRRIISPQFQVNRDLLHYNVSRVALD